MIDTIGVLGYAWPLSVAPGEKIEFRLSSETLSRVNACVVRVRCGDPDPIGPGVRVSAMMADLDGPIDVAFQPIHPGSFAIVEDRPGFAALREFSFGCYMLPTLVGAKAQTIASRWSAGQEAGWKLELDQSGQLCLSVADAGRRFVARCQKPLLASLRENGFSPASQFRCPAAKSKFIRRASRAMEAVTGARARPRRLMRRSIGPRRRP